MTGGVVAALVTLSLPTIRKCWWVGEGQAGGLIYLGWCWLEEERSWGHISVFSVQYWQSLTVDTSER